MPEVESPASPPEVLVDGGDTGRRLRAFDWTRHPLGPPAGWPPGLRFAVNLILASPESMYLCWGPELYFFSNDAYAPILGPRLDEAVGNSLPVLWHDAWEAVRPTVEKALAGQSVQFADLPIEMARRGVPEETWWTFSFSPLYDENMQVAGVLCITNEQTERLVSMRAQRASDELNRQILGSAIDYAIISTGLDARITSWNAGAHLIMGWTEDEMLGQPADRFFTPEDVRDAVPAQEMRMALETGRGTDERWHLRSNGERFWSSGETMALRGDSGEVTGFLKILRDRTEERRAGQALKEAQESLRSANESLELRVEERTRERDRTWNINRDLMGVADSRGVWLSINPAWERSLGWPADQIIGRTSEWMEHPDDRLKTRSEIRDLGFGEITSEFVNRFRGADGRYRWLSWTAVMDDGLLYCSARDVTDATERQGQLEQAEEALRQAQKMEAIGQLTGGVAHDFNNLLTIIRSSVDLMRHPKASEERRGRYLNAISDTVDRAARLTGQLLAFARRQALQPEVFEVNHRLLTVAEMIRAMVGSLVKVEVQPAPERHFTHADTSQFDTAVVNLAVNARDAMEGHGRMRITVRAATAIPAHRAQAEIAGSFVAVSLADEGHGIPETLIEKIFEPFFTTKEVGKGTGLGLSQVFGFVRQSGGETRVHSTPGQGTTFTMYLPAVEAPAPAPAPDGIAPDAPRPGSAHDRGASVLLVEDNPEVGTFSRQILQDMGYRTEWAASGEQALEWLAEPGRHFDVVLSDVMMPGISGVELALRLRDSHPQLPVILTSGYSNVLAQEPGHGFPLVQKPYSIEILAKALNRAVLRNQARNGAGT